MTKCNLCKKNFADKKGSHIVPHFMLKRIENVEGKNGRDYELGFCIEEFDTKSYFGRALQQDKLEKVYGTLTDKDIEENKHPLIADNFFCAHCEKRLSALESEYSKTIENTGLRKYRSGVLSEIGMLFWMSILWRMFINGKSGVKLTSHENEILRKILDRTLMNSIVRIDYKKMRAIKELKKISYILVRCPKFSEKNPTLLFMHPDYLKPYSLVIDEYIFFSFENDYYDIKNNDFLGIKMNIYDFTANFINSTEEISIITDDSLKAINSAIINKMKSLRLAKIDFFFNELHIAIGGKGNEMPKEVKEQIMHELTSNEKKIGRKYTMKDLADSTFYVLKNISH